MWRVRTKGNAKARENFQNAIAVYLRFTFNV